MEPIPPPPLEPQPAPVPQHLQLLAHLLTNVAVAREAGGEVGLAGVELGEGGRPAATVTASPACMTASRRTETKSFNLAPEALEQPHERAIYQARLC